MAESFFRSSLFAAVAAGVLGGSPAAAAEVTFNAPQAPGGFTERLRSASLTLSTAAQEGTTAQDLLAAAQADYSRLIGVLYAEGYYGGTIRIRVNGQEAASIPPLRAPDRIDRIDITVERRAGFFFSTARVAPLPPGTELPEKFAPGQLAKGTLIGEATRTGIAAWRATGHAKALVADQTIVADHARRTLDADIRLAPGPRLRFGALEIEDTGRPSRVRPSRIRAIAGLPTGRVFSPDKLDDAANRLRRSGAFRSVVMTEAETPNPDGTLDIATRVTDAKRRRVGAGAELSSLEGVTLSGFWLHRNLLGGAERLRIDALVGGIGGDSGGEDYRLGLRYDRPATFTPDTGLFLLARIEDNDEPDYRERKAEIGGGLTHVFSRELTAEAGITYRYSDIDDDLGSRQLQHLLFPLRATWDRRDDPLDARKGVYIDLSLTPFAGLDQGGSGGTRLYTDVRSYFGLGQGNRFVLAGRAQLGSVAGGSLTDVPADMLFYSGGAGTVRGQRYQSLGVDLAPGITVGGRSFMGFSGELRAGINDKVQAVGFVDTGFVGEEALGDGRGRWHSGAGIGARYFTGVGPIRVDIATPLDGDAGTNFELYIGIGQAF
ncbi:autotransporter secretion outer membrane protein TamA [Roseovarius azorensis]|uniref:Autotransporter secretion outer membrane protein TamA n=1 Tax=Roseovarius azorensis TaxID=1287727 RepID=A0A1H7LEK8_9RHOB|nr:autotransporter secretion outer membrane protein TamA [Roseovarius azorensis]